MRSFWLPVVRLLALVGLLARPLEARAETDPQVVDVRGIVVDAFGVPLPGALVWLSLPQDSGLSPVEAASGSRGRFVLRGVRVGEKLPWKARLDGYRHASGVWGGETLLQVVLERAGSIAGRVLGPDAEPLAGATIAVTILDEPGTEKVWGQTVRTGPDGAFSFWRVEPGEVRMGIRSRGCRPRRLTLPPERQAGEEDLGDLHLSRGRTLIGRVHERGTRAPVMGAEVVAWLESREDAAPEDLVAFTDARGGFELSLPLAVRATLTATKDGFARAEVPVTPRDELLELAMEAGGWIEGAVCARAWELESLLVSVRVPGSLAPDQSVRMEGGAFRSERLATGNYLVSRRWRLGGPESRAPEAATPESIPVQVRTHGVTPLAIGCHRHTVTGRVRDDGGQGVPGMPLWIGAGAAGGTGLTRPDGSFEVSVPAAGSYRVQPLHGGSVSGECDTRAPKRGAAPCDLVWTPVDRAGDRQR